MTTKTRSMPIRSFFARAHNSRQTASGRDLSPLTPTTVAGRKNRTGSVAKAQRAQRKRLNVLRNRMHHRGSARR